MIKLQREREARGWSRNALATIAGLSYGRVGQIENGRVRPPHFSRELKRLAYALDLPLAEAPSLLDEVDADGR